MKKLTTAQALRFNFAKKTAPFKIVPLANIEDKNFHFFRPKIHSIENHLLSQNLLISDDLCLSTIELSSFDMLPSIGNQDFNFILQPIEVQDVTDLIASLTSLLEIENIDFQFKKSRIEGKNYEKVEINTKLLNQPFENQEQTEKQTDNEESIIEKVKINPFDVFDLIFPALQPPLGQDFNNVLVLPRGKTLRPYQVEGSKFLIENFSALLADDMGLGKSIQVIMAMKVLFNKGQLLNAIILCPKAVLSDWKNKFSEWAFELRIQVIDGNKEKRKLQWNTQAHVFICTYETLNNDFETENTSVKTFDLAVFDEAQKIKNPDTKLCKAARKINAEYKWAMTGTPMENRVEELVCILETIQPTIFHLPMKTVSIFGNTGKNLKMQLTKDNVKNAYEKISKRRLKKVLMDLPEGDRNKLPSKVSELREYELYEKQQLEYDKVLLDGKKKIIELGNKATRINALALITVLKQLCNFSSDCESPKLDILKEDLEKIVANGDKALVFSQYVKTLEQIKPQLLEYNPLVYTGDLNTKQREEYVANFQKTEDNQVMLLSLKAANAGITLTKASYVYHFDLWWNPATMAQATDRVHRIGQEKMVEEKILVAKGTIEEKIYQILEKKKDLFKDVIDNFVEESTISTTLTDEEIFGILGLSVPNKTKENIFEVSKKSEIKSVSKSEIKIIDTDFSKLTPIEFEEFVAKLFEKLGYFVNTTQKSYDGGIDIFVKRQTPTGFDNGIIQCKHKQDSTKSIGINTIRELYGTLQADKSLHRGILATNAKFSKECYNFIQGKTIELIDGVALRGLIEKMK